MGLCRTLGCEQVIDYPYKALYHDPLRRVHHVPQVLGRLYEEAEVAALLRDQWFDLAVLSSPRYGTIAAWESLLKYGPMPPLVLIDGEDDALLRREVFHRYQCALYFKREYRSHRGADDTLSQRAYPLPFAAIREIIPIAPVFQRDTDVSYAGRISHPKRQKAVEMLRHASGIKFLGGVYAEADDRQSKLLTGLPRLLIKLKGDPVVTVAQKGVKLSQVEYHTLLGRSKMALSIRGGGFDTLRYWEIVASGTLLLSEQPDIEIPNNFVHGKHALFFRPDLSDLVDLVRIYARDPQGCATMAAEGYKHLLQYHTCERRAEYFLGICRGAI